MVTAAKRLENIKKYHELSKSSFPEDRTSYRPKIEYQIKKMIEGGYIKITCIVDTREQLPYKESEIGLPTVSLKNDVGDYNFTVFIELGEWYKMTNVPLDLVIERKTCADLYGTLMNRKSRDRFYREIDRAKDLDLCIFAECSKAEFYAFVPPHKRSKLGYWVAKLLPAKRATIAGLEARGVHVCWQGSRKESCLSIRPAVEQWVLKNYEKVFKL